MVVPAHVMTQNNPFDFPVAMNVRQGNNGRLIAVTYPLVSGTIPTATFPQRASVVLLKMLGFSAWRRSPRGRSADAPFPDPGGGASGVRGPAGARAPAPGGSVV